MISYMRVWAYTHIKYSLLHVQNAVRWSHVTEGLCRPFPGVAISTASSIPIVEISTQGVVLQSMKVKEESEKAGLKLNIQRTKIMASSPITSWQIDGKQWKQ